MTRSGAAKWRAWSATALVCTLGAALLSLSAMLPLAVAADGDPAKAAEQAIEVPKGEVTQFTFDQSKVFPGTTRDVWLYVPRQYDGKTPACVHVNQDGIQFNAPAVFDELIAKKQMPVTIGVFVMHGRVKAPSDNALDRFNRSYEYDGLGDAYVRFLLDELLPDIEKRMTADKREIHLSKNGNDRSIGGTSSGAICAFNAAWERPDAFSRVFSGIGTYVGLRGGNEFSTLIRKVEPKPIRVFLQDGSNDLNIYGGDWWMANQAMERSLVFAGYEVNHEWGDGGHNNDHAGKVFPEAMKWLWKDWPAPVKAGKGSQQMKELVREGEGWKRVGSEDYESAFCGLAANAKGDVFSGIDAGVLRIAGSRLGVFSKRVATVTQSFTPDGRLLAADGNSTFIFDAEGRDTSLHSFYSRYVTVAHDGGVFGVGESIAGPVFYITPQGDRKVVRTNVESPTGVALSPDQSLLYVADGKSHWVYSYQIQLYGTLGHGQKYYHLHVPDDADDAGAAGMCVDRDGRLYVATRMGVQICDQAGRVNCILPAPAANMTHLCFGGTDRDVLYAICDGKLFSRKLKTKGVYSFEKPIKPVPPRL